jgi:Histidine kinase
VAAPVSAPPVALRAPPPWLGAVFLAVFIALSTVNSAALLPWHRALPDALHWSAVLLIDMAALGALGRYAERRGWSLPRESALGLAISMTVYTISCLFDQTGGDPWINAYVAEVQRSGAPPPNLPLAAVTNGLLLGAGLFALWMLFFRLPTLHAALQREQAEAEQLRRQADLGELRARLAPHFLLNTLHATAGLLGDDPKQARRVLTALGDLLADALDERSPLATLAQEIDWLRRYGSIIEARYGAAVRLEFSLPPAAAPITLPRGLLQPLVENAIQHGVLRGGGSQVAVEVRSHEAGWAIRVEDDGPGALLFEREGGQGIALVRRRLALHNPAHQLVLSSSSTGTVAEIRLALSP